MKQYIYIHTDRQTHIHKLTGLIILETNDINLKKDFTENLKEKF